MFVEYVEQLGSNKLYNQRSENLVKRDDVHFAVPAVWEAEAREIASSRLPWTS